MTTFNEVYAERKAIARKSDLENLVTAKINCEEHIAECKKQMATYEALIKEIEELAEQENPSYEAIQKVYRKAQAR